VCSAATTQPLAQHILTSLPLTQNYWDTVSKHRWGTRELLFGRQLSTT